MTSAELIHPRTGEILDLRTVGADTILDARDLLTDREREIREFRRQLDDELVRRADHEGRRSISFDQFRIDVSPPLEKVWDVDRLVGVLDELVEEGVVSSVKASRCVKTEVKPVWNELRNLDSDPRTQSEIRQCYAEEPRNRYVKVVRR